MVSGDVMLPLGVADEVDVDRHGGFFVYRPKTGGLGSSREEFASSFMEKKSAINARQVGDGVFLKRVLLNEHMGAVYTANVYLDLN